MTRAIRSPATVGLAPPPCPGTTKAARAGIRRARRSGQGLSDSGLIFAALRCCPAAALCLIVTGCHAYDTYRRPGVWHPDDANAVNIAAMASRPADLIRGHGPGDSDGRQAVKAISRVWWDGQAFPPTPAGSGTRPGGTGAKGFATPLSGGSSGGGSP